MIVFRSFDSGASACFEKEWEENLSVAAGGSVRVEYMHASAALVDRHRRGELIPRSETVAARAMEAARRQGDPAALKRLAAVLYRRQGSDDGDEVRDLARRCGLDSARFTADFDSPEVHRRVEADIALAAALGVERTPALFIEGRRVPNLCVRSAAFWKLIGLDPGLTESIADAGFLWGQAAGGGETTRDHD